VPTGIAAETARFLDAFLLFCGAADSPLFAEDGRCQRSADNFATVVKRGREPGLMLDRDGAPIGLRQWGEELLDRIAPYAALYDQTQGGHAYADSLAAQRAKLADVELTPSARLLREVRDSGLNFHDYTLRQSSEHAAALRAQSLPADRAAFYAEMARKSVAGQAAIEASDDVDFATYVARYHEALKNPLPA
jgi:glutamate--cysteine ligase